VNKPTVQRELENALSKLGWQGKSLLLAGRTDSGVHAAGQVAVADLNWPHTLESCGMHSMRASRLTLRSNRSDCDRRVPSVSSAVSRWYRYRLFCQPVRDPAERYAWMVPQPLNAAALRLAPCADRPARFRGFGTAPRKGPTLRTVMEARWLAQDDEWYFDVWADAFLPDGEADGLHPGRCGAG
jgi:tRNA pseudouridine38-40 synthase